MHKYFTMLAEALNDAGYSANDRMVIKLDLDFTPEIIKEAMWKKIQDAMYPGKTSTTQLSTAEVGKVYEELNRLMAEHFQIHVPFPSVDE